jgi:hypothetical protein
MFPDGLGKISSGMAEWDMHDPGAAPVVDEGDRLPEGTRVKGVVVCHHPFGLGMRLSGRDECGHVDIISIAPPNVRLDGSQDFRLSAAKWRLASSGTRATNSNCRCATNSESPAPAFWNDP